VQNVSRKIEGKPKKNGQAVDIHKNYLAWSKKHSASKELVFAREKGGEKIANF